VTTAFDPPARPGRWSRGRNRLARGWRRFRRWRRGRPFWAGFFLLLGGLQLFLSSNLSLGGLQVHVGPEGFLSYLLPLLLLACGVLLWATPQHRLFYGVIGALTSVYSLIGLNLGGFFLGMLFGVIGSTLAIAWVPVQLLQPPAGEATEPEPEAERYAAEPVTASFDELMTGPLTDTLPQPVNPLVPDAGSDRPEAEPEQPAAPTRPAEPGVPRQRPPSPDSSAVDDPPPHGLGGPLPRRSPPLYSIALILLAVGALGTVGLNGAVPAYAAPCDATPTAGTQPAPATTSATTPASTPAAAPAQSQAAQSGDTIGDVVGGVGDAVGDLLVGAETPTPGVSAATSPTPTGAGPTEQATAPATGCDDSGSGPGPGSSPGPGAATPTAGPQTPAPRIALAAGQPAVAARPSRLTGSRVTMSGLSFDGVAELKTIDGTAIRALQFSMEKSVTTDFKLEAPEANGARVVFETKALTVNGNVTFYASRFAGKLCDPVSQLVCVIPLVFTPDSPPSLTLPEMAFGDPDIQLVFVDSDTLTGTPILRMTVES
jgi:Family of unknown function (DUF6114)